MHLPSLATRFGSTPPGRRSGIAAGPTAARAIASGFAVTRWVIAAVLLVMLAGCASMKGTPQDVLERNQYAWSGAIRWGDFDGALQLVDPDYKSENPITALELSRYEQVQISSYRIGGSSRNLDAGLAVRDIQIGVINRHTQAERTVSFREEWRWDEAANTWWLTTGLPDLWDGQ